jgi:HK97 family phage major capsid protein
MNTEEMLKEVRQQIGRTFEEFKSELDKQPLGTAGKASVAAVVKDALAEVKLDKIQQTLDDLTGKREDLEKRLKEEKACREDLERKFNKLQIAGNPADDKEAKAVVDWNSQVKGLARQRGIAEPGEQSVEEYRLYKRAQGIYLRKGLDALSPEERKAMIVGSDADGGHFVTPDVTGRIVTRVFELSPIRAISAVQAIGSDSLEGIEDLNEADAGWVGEVGTRSDTNTPQVAKYKIEAHEMYAQPKASQKLLDDSNVDIEAWLAGKVADKFARVEGAAFVNGNGVGKPRGFTSYTTAATADATRAWGQLEHVNTGANGAFHTTQADPLFDLIAAFKPHFLNGSRWVTRRTVIAAIRKFKTTTTLEYIWQPGLQAGQPDRLLGYPITLAEDMPALGTGSLSMALGNFTEGYQIVDRLGVRTLRDPFTDKPYVKFYTIKRTGGGVLNFEAIKFVRFAS